MEVLENIFVTLNIALKLEYIDFNERCVAYKHTEFEGITTSTNVKQINNKMAVYIDPINYEDLEDDGENIENYLLIPTYEQVLKWFRDKGLYGVITPTYANGFFFFEIYGRTSVKSDNKDNFIVERICIENHFKTYEQAQEQLILKLIEIYKNGKTDI